jgi:hypothetical protein
MYVRVEVMGRLTHNQERIRAELPRLEAAIGLASIKTGLARETKALVGRGAGI